MPQERDMMKKKLKSKMTEKMGGKAPMAKAPGKMKKTKKPMGY